MNIRITFLASAALVLSTWLTAQSSNMRFHYTALSNESQCSTMGGDPCNHKDDYLWCNPGGQSCSGKCETLGADCTGSASQRKATSGSIYLCDEEGNDELQKNCKTGSGNQTCEFEKVCICRRGLNTIKGCEKENETDTSEKMTVETTTDCTM